MPQDLMKIKGIGPVRAGQLMEELEWLKLTPEQLKAQEKEKEKEQREMR